MLFMELYLVVYTSCWAARKLTRASSRWLVQTDLLGPCTHFDNYFKQKSAFKLTYKVEIVRLSEQKTSRNL